MASLKMNIDTSRVRIKRIPLETMQNDILRKVGANIIRDMTVRIHENGLKANGSSIGPYSKKYMKVRARNNRDEKNIIFSLTRKLEGDWTLVATERGMGVGFKTPDIADLVVNVFNSPSYKYRGVFVLSKEEREAAIEDMKIFYLEELRKEE